MARAYTKALQPSQLQTEQTDPKQTKNNAGGYSYTVSPIKQLERFLVLGSLEGTYYVDKKLHTKDNVGNLLGLLVDSPVESLKLIQNFLETGRAPKQETVIFALAVAGSLSKQILADNNIATSLTDADFLLVRQAALESIKTHIRTGTQLFMLISYLEDLRGWGSNLKRNVQQWYLSKPLSEIEYQLLKYKNREGYTHRDVLRLSHPKVMEPSRDLLFRYTTQSGGGKLTDETLAHVKADQSLQRTYAAHLTSTTTETSTQNLKAVAELITEYDLPREAINPHLLNSIEIWEAMLPKMPYAALVRSLGKLSAVGLLKPLSETETLVIGKLTDPVLVKKSKIHPVSVYKALKQYSAGKGDKGKLSWLVCQRVVCALEEAFYLAFKNVEPAGKNFLLGVDVSGSMYSPMSNIPMHCHEASAIMALVQAKTEPNCYVYGFTSKFVDLRITAKDTIESAIRKTQNSDFGNTDCALPMLHAIDNKLDVDVFAVYTDNETWAGRRGKPHEVLKRYNDTMGKQAKLVVVGMTATNITIAEPGNPLMLDIAGFDTTTPSVISQFANS